MQDDRMPILDLYERRTSDGETFLTGAFGGIKLFIHPIRGADPNDRCWRLYLAPRAKGVLRDRHRPTAATPPPPRPPSMQGRSLADIGHVLKFYEPPGDDEELDL